MRPIRLAVAALAAAFVAGGAHAQEGAPISVRDQNNAPFALFPPFAAATAYTPTQLVGVRSIEMSLTAPGTVTLTDQSGNVMALPYTVVGVYQLPVVPVRVDFSGGAAGSLWMLK